MGDNPAGFACRNRIAEWICTLILFNFGLTCLIWPESLSIGAFRYLLAAGVTASAFSWVCLSLAIVRTAALIFNGRSLPWSARVRAVGAVLGGMVFAALAWCLGYLIKDTGAMALGVGTHVILAGVEVYSTLRAGADVNDKNPNGETSERTIIARVITRDTTSEGGEPSGLSSVRDTLKS